MGFELPTHPTAINDEHASPPAQVRRVGRLDSKSMRSAPSLGGDDADRK
jgi:hypothetical protein